MRVRDHIALSTAGAVMVSPWVGRRVLGAWAGSVLIDADHYVWFCVRERRLNPAAAVRFFNEAQPPQHAATRTLHGPVALLAVGLLGALRRGMLPLAAGMGVHVALDAYHEARMRQARDAALRRDRFVCQACGTRAAQVGTHVRRQPRLLPSYRTRNVVSLCDPCHQAAHDRIEAASR